MNDMRQQFEAYWQERQRQTWNDPTRPIPERWGAAYRSHHWEAWQAATKAALEADAETCVKLRNLYIAEGRPAQEEAFLIAATMDCEQAIRARGTTQGEGNGEPEA